MESLSLVQAWRLALASGAGFAPPGGRGAPAVTRLVDRLGFVQIDTISVVERAHHHILFSRLPSYRPDQLARAEVFEYWAHAAAFLPWKDYRFTLARKERVARHGHDWYRVDRDEAQRVLDRIRAEGPLRTRDFEDEQKHGGWWEWKPSKRALEYLFMAGQLMIRREGFQKVFDLTERCLPPGTDTSVPTPAEVGDWYVDRALGAGGVVARDEIAYLRQEFKDEVEPALARAVEGGTVVPVTLEGQGKRPHWVRAADLAAVDQLPGPDRQLRILSPFDPFLIHRKRLERLFGFTVVFECYVPAPKRTFGYFALPLLWGGQFVGHVDLKADRARGVLEVRNLRYDGPARRRPAFDAALTQALGAFAAFNGVTWPTDGGPSAAE